MNLTIVYSKSLDKWAYMVDNVPQGQISSDVANKVIRQFQELGYYHLGDDNFGYKTWKYNLEDITGLSLLCI